MLDFFDLQIVTAHKWHQAVELMMMALKQELTGCHCHHYYSTLFDPCRIVLLSVKDNCSLGFHKKKQ
jgi:hypothetical protein